MKLFSMKTVGKDSQLIVTTHETGLLDFELIRRDEVWFTEKIKVEFREFIHSKNSSLGLIKIYVKVT